MRCAWCGVFAVLTLACVEMLEGQSHRISGRVRINPDVTEPVDITLRVYQGDPATLVTEVPVDRQKPYRFNKLVNAGTAMTIRVVIDAPVGYSATRLFLTKSANADFDDDIFVKRHADIYAGSLERANEVDDAEESLRYLELAGAVAATPSQHVQVTRQMGLTHLALGDFVSQQEVYRAFYNDAIALEVSPTKRRTLWGERLDGFLEWVGYNRLRMPEQDFGRLVASDSVGAWRDTWTALVRDFQIAYPTASLPSEADPAEQVTNQLRLILSTIRPRLEG